MSYTTVASPYGEITIVGTITDATVHVTGIYWPDHRPAPSSETFGERDDPAFAEVSEQLAEYFAGERTDFTVSVEPAGTDFQHRVWRELARIPYGETRTYGQIAAAIEQPTAVRAVGLANSRNPVSLLLPCHRVIASSGALTGYAGGLDVKRSLIERERERERERARVR